MSRNVNCFLSVALVSMFVFSACTGEEVVNQPDHKPMPMPDGDMPVKEMGMEDGQEAEAIMDSMWTINEGIVMDYASNPMPVYQDEDQLVFAFESRAEQLLEAPSADKSGFMLTEDGESFERVDNSDGTYDYRLAPLEFPDGTLRRYVHDPKSGGIESYVTEDGVTFVKEEGIRYAIDTGGDRDPHVFGVSTFFVDSDGGVVLLYNANNAAGDIVVNKAYAAPETEGMEFELVEENILGGSLPTDGYADPHSLVRENGDVWVIVMHQADGPAPPLVKRGDIFAYVSRDDGKTFELEGQLMSYRDFEEFEVWSLNDPKIVEFDGELIVIVAAMVLDEEDPDKEYKWVLVSANP